MKMKSAGMIAALSALALVLGISGCTRKAKPGDGEQGKAKVDAPLKSGMKDQKTGQDRKAGQDPKAGKDPKAGHDPKAGKDPKAGQDPKSGQDPKAGKMPLVKAPEGDQRNVVEGANRFALALYARLRGTGGNVFLSPWSINTAVGMTYAGAKGTTATQMAKVMRYTLAQPELHPAVGAVQSRLLAAKGYELAVANRVFSQQGLALVPGFVSQLKKSYGSPVQQLNYRENPEAARKRINSWVKKQTRDRIAELLKGPDINKDTRMVLVNAIYFKGSWAAKFDKKNTKPRDFQVTAARKMSAPTMYQQGKFGYRPGADADVLEMGYAGKGLSMVVLLPKKVDGLAALEKSLTAERLAQLTDKLPQRKVKVYLPRFKMESRFDLKKQLIAMGMPLAFANQADFTGIAPKPPLKISKVIHQANCDVTEEGTVAAAATAVVMARGGSAARPAPIPEFKADHPFLFLIRDVKTGVILFLGRFTTPK